MSTNQFSFVKWLASPASVSFALLIGVIFLFSNYSIIINDSNPDAGNYNYPGWLIFTASHIDSLFFSLTTAILMFQAKQEWQKILYCCLEAVMLFLNLNQSALTAAGLDAQFYIATYIAAFSGISFYFLGSLAKMHSRKAEAVSFAGSVAGSDNDYQDLQEEHKALTEVSKRTAYIEKYPKLITDLENGESIRKCAKKHDLSLSTVQNVKRTIFS